MVLQVCGPEMILGLPSWHTTLGGRFIRHVCGMCLGFGFFITFDTVPRLLWFVVANIHVSSIFGWASYDEAGTSLRVFWSKFWNQPVAHMLVRGVYLPIRAEVGSPLAKVAVFVVSGMAHTYAMNCTHQPYWMQGSMMCCFLIQPFLLAIEEYGNIQGWLWLRFAIFVSSLFFVEPLLATLGW